MQKLPSLMWKADSFSFENFLRINLSFIFLKTCHTRGWQVVEGRERLVIAMHFIPPFQHYNRGNTVYKFGFRTDFPKE